MEYKSKFQVVVFVYILTLLFVSIASTATLIVDKSGAGNYTTIQEAISNAREGDTVYVHSGIYREHVTMDKSITLEGEDRFRTVIDGSGSGSCIYVTADESEITGFTVQNGHWGIYLCSVSNCVVDSNIFVDNRAGDIYSDNSEHNRIINNMACSIYVNKKKNTLHNNAYFNITSYAPLDLILSIREGESLDFSVTTSSSGGSESILYKWTLDDDQQSTSDHWSYKPDYTEVTQGSVKKTVKVTVSDARCKVAKEWKVEVKDFNPPPTIISSEPGDRPPCLKKGESLEFSVSVKEPDGTEPMYKWTLDGDPKESTHRNWTYWPKDMDIGTKIVKVTVIDSKDDTLTDSHEWVVTICNREPTIVSCEPNNTTPGVEEGKSLIFSVTARDPEGSSLIYKWTLDNKEVPSSGNFWEFSPNYTESGTKKVNLNVSDGISTTSQQWTVKVNDVNQPPDIHSISPDVDVVYMSYNDSMTFCVDASDPDKDNLIYEWTLDGKKNDTARCFNFSPKDYLKLDDVKNGTNVTLVVNVSDGNLTAPKKWEIIIRPIPPPLEPKPKLPPILFIFSVGLALLIVPSYLPYLPYLSRFFKKTKKTNPDFVDLERILFLSFSIWAIVTFFAIFWLPSAISRLAIIGLLIAAVLLSRSISRCIVLSKGNEDIYGVKCFLSFALASLFLFILALYLKDFIYFQVVILMIVLGIIGRITEYLFSINTKLKNGLISGIISKNLKDTFRSKGFPLPDIIQLCELEEDKWEIGDEKRRFIVQKEDNKLNVYKGSIMLSKVDIMISLLVIFAFLLYSNFFPSSPSFPVNYYVYYIIIAGSGVMLLGSPYNNKEFGECMIIFIIIFFSALLCMMRIFEVMFFELLLLLVVGASIYRAYLLAWRR